MSNKTIDDFSAVTVPATTDTVIVTQSAVTKKETLAQIDTLLSATTKTLTNKTITAPVINTSVSGTAIDTDGTLAANSNTKLASQKAVKTYADTKQPLKTMLTSLALLGTAANKLLYSSALSSAAELSITANKFPAMSSAGVLAAFPVTDFALTAVACLSASTFKTATLSAGDIVQIVNTQTGAVATGTTALPYDDTIPQITEGDEFMTLAITPTSATNQLKIDVIAHLTNSNADRTKCAALFQDATAGALACAATYESTNAGMNPITFSHYMTAGTTSETTFRVRGGAQTGATTTFNGVAGSRLYGGVLVSSITITEVKV